MSSGLQRSPNDHHHPGTSEWSLSPDPAEAALQDPDKQTRRQKKKLLDHVEAWIKEDPDRAKQAFQESAGEVIDLLKGICRELAC